MTKREAWIVPLLSLVTCSIYYFYWQFVTTEELKRVSGRDDLNPVLDLIISLCCLGLWSIYVQYRNAGIVHECFRRASVQHEDRSTLILMLNVLAVFNGLTALLASAILQDEYNKLADHLPAGSTAPAPSAF